METTDKTKILEAVRKINECDEVLAYFTDNKTLYDKDFIKEVVIEFENDKKLQVARIKVLYIRKKQKEVLEDEDE
jgi:hypothetical protein